MSRTKKQPPPFAVRLRPEDRLALDALAMRLRVPRGEVLRRGIHVLLADSESGRHRNAQEAVRP